MNFDELYALYWVQTEWNKVLSDREIFAEEPLDVNEKVVIQGSTTTSSEWEKSTTEVTKIDDITFQSWLYINEEETAINEVSYTSQEEDQNETIDTFEYLIQSPSVKEELYESHKENIIDNQNTFSEPLINNERSDEITEYEEIATNSWEEEFSGNENNEFLAAI